MEVKLDLNSNYHRFLYHQIGHHKHLKFTITIKFGFVQYYLDLWEEHTGSTVASECSSQVII